MSILNRNRPPRPAIVYPDSDGKPMAENTLQFEWIVTIKEGLERICFDRDDVFVAGDLLWYPVEGHPEICVAAPTRLAAFGRPKGYRGSCTNNSRRMASRPRLSSRSSRRATVLRK